jgi:hypothetical protein
MGTDWRLESCCGTEEILFCILFGSYAAVNLLLWRTAIIKPMKLIAVFAHEMSHATACWLTGGSVKKIEVYTNEGGVTQYTGGMRCIIIPAGYVGGAFYGGLFVALSGDRIASTVSACVLVVALLGSLCYSPNKIVVALSLGFVSLTVLFLFLDWFVFDPLIQYLTLYYGVFIGFFSVYDIYDDLITRTAEGSDAVACHELIPCCMPRCVGVQFIIVALAFQGLGVYFALLMMTSNDN